MIEAPIHLEGYTINIVLPYDYEQSDTAYPVVYVQDGGDMVMDCYNQLDYMIRTKQIVPCIFVGIEPIDRNRDYTPWRAPGLSQGRPDFGGGAKGYLYVLGSLIKPHIDKIYRTKPESENTTIAGGSLGALVSLLASYWYPNIFGNYILLSPSMWYEGVLDFLQKEKLSLNRSKQRIYMYVGDVEGIYHTTRQQHMVPNCKEAAEILKEENFALFDFILYPGGTHDAHFFAYYFIDAMKRLFPSE